MIYGRSFIFNVLYLIWTGVCSIFICLGGIFYGYRGANIFAAYNGKGIQVLLRVILGITSEVRGKENLPADGKYLVACKHQSTWETLNIQNLIKDPVVIFKKELIYIPIFGQAILLAGSIAIDRSQGKKALFQMIKGSKDKLAQGRPIFIYPEGTRSAPEKAGHYHAGIYFLYHTLKAPVVPIALNSGYFWPRRGFLKKPGHIIVEILPPIMPGLDRGKFMKTLEETIEKASQKLAPVQ